MSYIARGMLFVAAWLFGIALYVVAFVFLNRAFRQWRALRGKTAGEVRAGLEAAV